MGINNKKIHCKTTTKLMIVYALQSVCGGIAFYISLFFKSNTGLDLLHISTVISATSIGNIIGSYIGGYVSDKYNPSYALKSGLVIQGLALLSLVFINNFYLIFFIMAVMGTGSYLYITSSNYVLNTKFNKYQQSRAMIISTQNIIANIGMLFAAVLMGYSADGYYKYIFISVAGLIIILAITLKHFDKQFYCINISNEVNNSNIKADSSLYLIGLLAIGLIGTMYSQHRIGYPLFLEENFGNINTGYLMALNPLIILLFQNIIIKKSTQLSEVFSLGIGLLFFSISFIILNNSINFYTIFLSCIFMTLGEILAITYAQSLAFGYAPLHMKGRVLGIYKSVYSMTKIMGAYIAGNLIHYTSYEILWNVCSCIGLGGFFISIIVLLHSKIKLSKKKIMNEELS